MKSLLIGAVIALYISSIVCPPVKVKKEETKEDPEVEAAEDINFGLEYERYLKEVVTVLETDDEFKKKLEESNITDIKSGDIARHLELVSHNIRTKLDELKRQELDRLRQIQRINMKRKQDADTAGIPLRDIPDANRLVAHLDHSNPHTFEVDDLSKLLKQASTDLEKLDKERKKEFKQYELEKEVLHKKEMQGLDEVARKVAETNWDEQKKKHKDHPKLHHPGSKDQLEEVWEESDGLAKDDFDAKTFFMLHDTNSDGVLDPVEVEALFQKELDKVYDPNAPEDDMMERYEEMNRMREHVMKEVDKNRDSYISLQEFMESTKTDNFEKDEGWKGLDEQELFTDEELAQFEREYEERRRQEYEYEHAQPGVIGVPQPSYIPPMDGENQPPHVPQPVQGQGYEHRPEGQHVGEQQHQQPPAPAHDNAQAHAQDLQQEQQDQPQHQEQQQVHQQQDVQPPAVQDPVAHVVVENVEIPQQPVQHQEQEQQHVDPNVNNNIVEQEPQQQVPVAQQDPNIVQQHVVQDDQQVPQPAVQQMNQGQQPEVQPQS